MSRGFDFRAFAGTQDSMAPLRASHTRMGSGEAPSGGVRLESSEMSGRQTGTRREEGRAGGGEGSWQRRQNEKYGTAGGTLTSGSGRAQGGVPVGCACTTGRIWGPKRWESLEQDSADGRKRTRSVSGTPEEPRVLLGGPGVSRAQCGGKLGPESGLSPDFLVKDLERQAKDSA